MKLNEFIEKIRYRTLKITIATKCNTILYEGTVGTYLTSVFRQKHGEKTIFAIYPTEKEWLIELNIRGDQL